MKKQSIDQIVDDIMKLEQNKDSNIRTSSSLVNIRKIFEISKEGYVRARVDGETVGVSDDIELDRKRNIQLGNHNR